MLRKDKIFSLLKYVLKEFIKTSLNRIDLNYSSHDFDQEREKLIIRMGRKKIQLNLIKSFFYYLNMINLK